jgi:hypothetical protein
MTRQVTKAATSMCDKAGLDIIKTGNMQDQECVRGGGCATVLPPASLSTTYLARCRETEIVVAFWRASFLQENGRRSLLLSGGGFFSSRE